MAPQSPPDKTVALESRPGPGGGVRRAAAAARQRSDRDRGQRLLLQRLPDRSGDGVRAAVWRARRRRMGRAAAAVAAERHRSRASPRSTAMRWTSSATASRRGAWSSMPRSWTTPTAAMSGCCLAVSDVTEARLAERLKDDLLQEKAILLQELQHRVANSLQIIASVLMQSARKVQSEETRSHLLRRPSAGDVGRRPAAAAGGFPAGRCRAAALSHRPVRKHRRLDDPRPRAADAGRARRRQRHHRRRLGQPRPDRHRTGDQRPRSTPFRATAAARSWSAITGAAPNWTLVGRR